jgi:hypothetical protein
MSVALIGRHIDPIWRGETCVVAASGPSLSCDVAGALLSVLAHVRVIAVNDAWLMTPWADLLYACDAAWWDQQKGTKFTGEKWSSHHANGNDKLEAARKYGLKLIDGKTEKGFSADPCCIHYGGNSGFQAVNLALLLGAKRIILVGFDMRQVGTRSHFFGDHPKPLRRTSSYDRFISEFAFAAKTVPAGVTVLNATPGSALKCFPMVDLTQALCSEIAA